MADELLRDAREMLVVRGLARTVGLSASRVEEQQGEVRVIAQLAPAELSQADDAERGAAAVLEPGGSLPPRHLRFREGEGRGHAHVGEVGKLPRYRVGVERARDVVEPDPEHLFVAEPAQLGELLLDVAPLEPRGDVRLHLPPRPEERSRATMDELIDELGMTQERPAEEVARSEERDEQAGGPRRGDEQRHDGSRIRQLPEEVREVSQRLVRIGRGRDFVEQDRGGALLGGAGGCPEGCATAPRQPRKLPGGPVGIRESESGERGRPLLVRRGRFHRGFRVRIRDRRRALGDAEQIAEARLDVFPMLTQVALHPRERLFARRWISGPAGKAGALARVLG